MNFTVRAVSLSMIHDKWMIKMSGYLVYHYLQQKVFGIDATANCS